MNTSFLTSKQSKFTAYATLYILIVLGALGLLNWLANRHNKSVDTTANKRFSLSPQTEKIVKNLKSDVKITYFDRTSDFTRAKDLLERYDMMSGKLSVEYVDPEKKPQVARAVGLRNLGTIFVDAGLRHEEAKSMTEEEITGAIIRALKTGERNVCFVSGSGEPGLDDASRNGFSGLKQLIEKNNYKTRSISLLDKPEVPADCTIAVVGGPRFDYVQPVVDALRKFVEGGGKALFMLGTPVQLGKQESAENKLLADVIGSWGVTLNRDVALDTSGIGQLFGFSEVVPLVTRYESHVIVREMNGIATAYPLARSLDVKNGGGKATVEKLFSTGQSSFSTSSLVAGQDIKREKDGPLTLAAAGTLTGGTPEKGSGRFVVVGSADFAANSILGFNGNRDMVMNMLNWLGSDEDLISIRPKDPEDRRLTLNKRQMQTIFYSSVILMPLLVIAAGFSVWWRRR